MDIEYLLSVVTLDFTEKYSNFSDFAESEQYKPIWNLCIQTIQCEDYVKNIRFCNDYYNMPPVRVFIDINRTALDEIAMRDFGEDLFLERNGKYVMQHFLKQSIGAFWGMVFRFGLHYDERRTVTMIKDKYYGIATASRFEIKKIEK